MDTRRPGGGTINVIILPVSGRNTPEQVGYIIHFSEMNTALKTKRYLSKRIFERISDRIWACAK